ncbi:MAG: S8 family serine peptidase [Anaeromyxobacter sp.]
MLRRSAALAASLVVSLAACSGGGGGDGGGGGGADTTPPTVIAVGPGQDATAVAVATTVGVQFSEKVDCATITAATFFLRQGLSTVVPSTVACQNDLAELTPTAPLAAGTIYNATVTTGVKDLAGNALAAPFSWSFTTVTSSGFTMSGTISAQSGQAVDVDTADPTPSASGGNNDDVAHAQALPSTVTVGGWASLVATSKVAADPNDYYTAKLAAGQVVTLVPAEATGADVDLCVFELANPSNQLCSNNDVGQTEQISLTNALTVGIQVTAFAGSTNYTLVIGQGKTAATASAVRFGTPIVPGELLVRFRDGAVSARAAAGGPKNLAAKAAELGLVALGGDLTGGPAHLGLPLDPALRAATLAKLGVKPVALSSAILDDEATARQETWNLITAMRARDDVATADPNYIFQPQAVPNDAFYPYQWHYPLIQLPQAWDITQGSSGVIVAVVDTGQGASHPDFPAGKLVAGYDFISTAAISGDGGGRDGDPTDPGDGANGTPSSFHGTHVAGTVGAATNDNSGSPTGYNGGVAGVAWGSKIMPVRVLGKGGGTSADIIDGVKWAAGLAVSGVTPAAKHADILNLSLGCQNCYSATEEAVYQQVHDAGVFVIAAAGNANTSVKGYPGAYNGVTCVAAVDSQKQRAPYSNFNDAVDIAAPGGNTGVDLDGDGYADGVLSTMMEQDAVTPSWKFYQGTSMASPHMAGVVALMKSVCSTLTPADLDTLISTGKITDLVGGKTGKSNEFGYGLVNALKAVQEAQAKCSVAVTTALKVDPVVADFGNTGVNLTLTASKVGSGTLSVTGVTDDAAWLAVTETTVDASKLGTYTATVNRTGLADGAYKALITFNSSDGKKVTVAVTMRVGAAAPTTGDAGYVYLLVIDPNKPDPVTGGGGRGSGGTYTWQFTGVPAGKYILVAGTDSDDDGFICDDGEACGAWPTLGVVTQLDFTGNKTGLDFTVGFDPGTGLASAGGDAVTLPAGGVKRPLVVRPLGGAK